ncbi:MAG: decaprenyl-phosphate phosphoribosyltransferase, partial [Dehalococcoidales bacterium]|nr:decaprenyl-phosphate phosphoribosyltransferase [Dehalococcoidales bacterium]
LIASAGFILFCALSSGIYLLNDLADIANDRNHPRKRYRPIASGWVPPRLAAIASAVLIATALPLSFLINVPFGILAASYVAVTAAYTYYFKHIVILDVFGLSAGFVIRAVAGAAAVAVPISPWLYVCTVLGALFIGINKRRHELLLLESQANAHRPILQEYTAELLGHMTSVVTSTLVMAYSLYTFSAPNLPENHAMMLTVPFVLYGIFRYLYLVHVKNGGGSPEEALLTDVPLLLDALLWLVASVVILYTLS